MSVLEYFLVPELILDFAVCLVCVFYIKKESLAKMKGRIEFGPITNETLMEMTPGVKKNIVKGIVCYSLAAMIITSLIATAFTIWVEPTLVSFFVSLAAEAVVTVAIFIPLFKKLKQIV